ncbi:MAG TPA: hypothetical protein VEJ86_09670, partial [Candidatus Binataceae bacterium]|nr:hypothetical protein [Candidatus Binataceae bacterium]
IASNARLNDLATVRAICADLRARRIAELEPASFDLVVANPPYRALRSGRDVPERGRRLGRTETGAGLRDFVAAARRFVRNGGRVALVFTASRSAELIATLREYRLEPKRIRFVHPRASAPAASCLIEARADGGVEVTVEPPLWLHEGTGEYTAEARWWLGLETAPRNQARNSDASSAMR